LRENGILEPLFEAMVQQSRRFNAQNTANTLWALATLDISTNFKEGLEFLNLYFLLTQTLIDAPVAEMNRTEFLQIFKAFALFDVEPYPKPLSLFLESPAYQYIREQALTEIKNSAFPSMSQKNCYKTIKALHPEWEILQEQHIPGTAEIVDIYIPEKELIIEFDGPSHYDFMGQENIHTQNKRALLKKFGYQIVNICYQDWNHADSHKEFLRQKIDNIFMKSPKLLYRFEKQSEIYAFQNFMGQRPEIIDEGMQKAAQQSLSSRNPQ
jgi:hypothetical protein